MLYRHNWLSQSLYCCLYSITKHASCMGLRDLIKNLAIGGYWKRDNQFAYRSEYHIINVIDACYQNICKQFLPFTEEVQSMWRDTDVNRIVGDTLFVKAPPNRWKIHFFPIDPRYIFFRGDYSYKHECKRIFTTFIWLVVHEKCYVWSRLCKYVVIIHSYGTVFEPLYTQRLRLLQTNVSSDAKVQSQN